MKITLKLYASLGQFLPDGAKSNEVTIEVPDGETIVGLLDTYNVPREACHLVLLNGVFQAPGMRGEKKLSDGDALAVWPPVAGG